ncbi:MAG: hypothetical protein HQ538_01360 [Parcubacteria group bacterium]|nr:hypothetical protein [Parcubacteria group bacterium]
MKDWKERAEEDSFDNWSRKKKIFWTTYVILAFCIWLYGAIQIVKY